MQKETVVTYFKVISRHIPGDTQDNKGKRQSGQPGSESRFKIKAPPSPHQEAGMTTQFSLQILKC